MSHPFTSSAASQARKKRTVSMVPSVPAVGQSCSSMANGRIAVSKLTAMLPASVPRVRRKHFSLLARWVDSRASGVFRSNANDNDRSSCPVSRLLSAICSACYDGSARESGWHREPLPNLGLTRVVTRVVTRVAILSHRANHL